MAVYKIDVFTFKGLHHSVHKREKEVNHLPNVSIITEETPKNQRVPLFFHKAPAKQVSY